MEIIKMVRKIIVAILSMGFFLPVIAQNSFIKSFVPDSVMASASEKYKDISLIKRLFIGTNYRKVWSTEVKIPVFHLPQSGMKIIELGGGQQTKSLKLEDQKGREWSLRTVDKDAAGAIPKPLKGTLAQKIVQEIISGSYPYAPLVVGYLAKSAGIVAPDPKLYYVPHDAGLGKYQGIFTGKVCYLEEREPTRKGSKETESTSDVQEEIIEANDRLIIQREVLKARLLDMLVADWDRHADQWRWGVVDSTKAKFYYAIPRDRDQAFFMAKGLIPKVGKFVAMHHINWFKYESRGLKKLNYKSWKFDQMFLNDLDAHEWERVTREFTTRLTDQVIAEAVKKLPPEIYVLGGTKIELKLKSRRNSLQTNIMKYYAFLSKIVHVNGSNENEIFQVTGISDSIKITVFRQGTQGKRDTKIYERKFKQGETYLIYLMGYKGADKFVIDPSAKSKIKIHMFGGEGCDEYTINGSLKNIIHDIKNEKNTISKTRHTKVELD
jgi:hypothetical protein